MPRRSCVLTGFFFPLPNKVTGVSVVVFKLMAALARRHSFRLVFLTNWTAPEELEKLKSLGVEVRHAKTFKSDKLSFFHNAYLLARTATAVGADLIFTPLAFGALVGKQPSVIFVHDMYRETHPQLYPWHRIITERIALSLSARKASRIICNSQKTESDLCALRPEAVGKTEVVYLAPSLPSSSGSNEDGRVAPPHYGLVVANLAPSKNIRCLVDALLLMHKSGHHPRIRWVGRDDVGGFRDLLATYPELSNLECVGSVDDKALAALYRGANYYINTSVTEGFCIPIIEAQSCGVPVICSDIPIFHEVAGRAGVFFDPNEPEALAAAIKRMTTDAEWRRSLISPSLENALRFSWDKSAEKLEKVFCELLPV